MARWLVVCLLLVIGSFALMLGIGTLLGGPGVTSWSAFTKLPGSSVAASGATPSGTPTDADKTARPGPASGDGPVKVSEFGKAVLGALQPLVIQEARLLSTEKVDVPTEREGKLVCIATEIKPGEIVPKEKIVAPVDFGFLAIELNPGERVSAAERLTYPEYVDAKNKLRVFRRFDETKDQLLPDRVILVREKLHLKKLEIGDHVERGQLLAIINPQLALEDLASKRAKLDSAEADRRASAETCKESQRRVDRMEASRAQVKASVNDDDYHAGILAVKRYSEEERSKLMLVGQSQAELKATLTTLHLHQIRAGMPGVVKTLFKQPGEGVKGTEPVLQIQNPRILRVEGFTEVQESLYLKGRLEKGRTLYRKAQSAVAVAERKGDKAALEAAEQLRQEALKMLEVIVEPSRPVPPLAVLRGHLNEVTCVAVSRGWNYKIISGGEDKMVRIWERDGDQPRWSARYQLDHQAVVKAVACTGPEAKRSLLLTGTANGQGRLFDLDGLSSGEIKLNGRHTQAINCVAFNPEGTICVTGSEDRTINVWDTATGELLSSKSGAHKNGVTALQFFSDKQFISVGDDRRMIVWTLGEDKKPEWTDEFDRRSNDVPVLSVSPDGKLVLFDDAREVRLLSMATHEMEGTLQNPANAPNFSTLALFAPDGKTILTNGPEPGRLQLWRTPTSVGYRGAELRQFAWNTGIVTCGAFTPDRRYAITGTKDNQVLVWKMPDKVEVSKPLQAYLSYVDEFVDSSLKRVTIRAEMEKPDWVIPGGTATIVIPQLPSR